jgi:hypothetical protein
VVRRVFDTGTSTLRDRFAGTLAADGTFAYAYGEPANALRAHGTFRASDDRVCPFPLDGETLVVDDQRLAIGDDGAVDASTRRTALLGFAIAKSLDLRDDPR